MNQPAYPAFDPSAARFLTFGQILDRIYRLMRAHFGLFLSVAAVQATALLVIFAGAGIGAFNLIRQTQMTKLPPHGFPIYFVVAFAVAIYLLLPAIAALYVPAASYAATQADLGNAVPFSDAYAVSLRRFGRHLWLMVLGALYVIVPVVVIAALIGLIVLLAIHANASGGWPPAIVALIPLFVLLYLGFIAYCILIMLRFALAYPVCVSEGLTAWNSLQRSAQLTRGAKGRIFLVLLVIYAATYVANLVLTCGLMTLGVLGAFAASLAHVAAGSPAFFILIGLAALGYLIVTIGSSMFSYAAFTTALAVIYHDQRRRKDGIAPESGMIPVS
jgi:hypothetical protein